MADPTFDLTAFVRGREKALDQNDEDLFNEQKRQQNQLNIDLLGESLDAYRQTKDSTIGAALATNAARRAGAQGTLEDYDAQRAVDAALVSQPENLTDAFSHTSPLERALSVRPQVAAAGPRALTYYQSTIVPRAISAALGRAQNDPNALNDVLMSPLAGAGRYSVVPGPALPSSMPGVPGAPTVTLMSKLPDGRMVPVITAPQQNIAKLIASQLGVTKLFSGSDAYQQDQRLALTDTRNFTRDAQEADTAAINAELALSRAGALDAQAEARLRAQEQARTVADRARSMELDKIVKLASVYKDDPDVKARVMAVLDRYAGATQ